MNIEYWPNNSLSLFLINSGLEFIHIRFLEVWGIRRIDVTYNLIFKRKNLILKENSKIIGWLGIENDGELTNACIEKGYKGIDNLIKLIKKAYEVVNLKYIYAEVPICRNASAIAFLQTGMRLEKPIKLIKLKYLERDIILIRLSIDKEKNIILNSDDINNDLQTISYLNCISKIIKIPEIVIK